MVRFYLSNDYEEKGKEIFWEVYHASHYPKTHKPNAIISMFTLFYKKVDSSAMIKHGMNILQQITQYLNPGRRIFALCTSKILTMAVARTIWKRQIYYYVWRISYRKSTMANFKWYVRLFWRSKCLDRSNRS